ncbi:DUF2304 domain-containing protein [Pseudodesulfovibrio sp. JC047]|uniref:DUF2304 domain-containing protein n=1 Tax=Pseudodesulfovibrio sp. JC047 TaxID=2683199 RepID=UPI001EF3309E|nr:DUF2304 domain-containing protein [Pseudodesulfovibrio sp. JC047]
MIRRQRLGVMHIFWWILAVFGLLFAGLFPQLLDRIGWMFGISYPPVLPILLALCFLFVKILTMDIERTKQEIRLRIMSQKMASYEAELQRLREEKLAQKDAENTEK